MLAFLDDILGLIAPIRLQVLMPSIHRATINAAIHEFSALAQLLALGAIALILASTGDA